MSDATSKKCPECGATEDWGGASWCPACGYYPAINRQVATVKSPEEEQVYEHWWEVVPRWVWPIAAGAGALLVVSLMVRVIFSDSVIRTWWTIGQMGLGFIAMGVVHFMAYLYAVGRSDKIGPLDMFLQPLAVWQPVFRGLPGSSNLVSVMALGLSAVVMGFFVVDGVDYLGIMQADADARKKAMAAQAAKDAAEGKKKTSAMGFMLQSASVMAQAQQAMSPGADMGQPESLEDALQGFAGAAGVTADGGLAFGGEGGGGMGDIGSALSGFAGPGGVDVEAYMDQQKSIASGEAFAEAGRESLANPLGGGSPGEASGDVPEASGDAGDGEAEDDSPQTSSTATGSTSTAGGSPQKATSPVAARPGTSPVSTTPAETMMVPRDQVECLVLGYTTNASGEIRSLLLAAAPDRRMLRFVAKVPVEQVDSEALAQMLPRFSGISSRTPVVRCPYGGRWLRPECFCLVSYSGWTADSRLNDAVVERITSGEAE